jgi:hypothetical protein
VQYKLIIHSSEYNADEKRNHHFFFGKQSDEKMMKRYRSV